MTGIMASVLDPLPIDEVLPDVVARLRAAGSLVLRAPPGAGKTTRVPPALLAAGFAQEGKILVLQPRRVAARATAARIAAEQGWRLGDEVGYQVRFESRTSGKTRLEIVTEGILLRRLLGDPFLPGIAAVLFDEFHERSLASDLALAMVRQVQQTVRPELAIVVMSATLAAEPIAVWLGGCPVVESLGRTFPVEIRHAATLDRQPLVDSVADGVAEMLDLTAGDVLAFLPGVGEIRQAARRLARLAEDRGLALCQLYGDLPADQQDAALQPGTARKIILATNVAETSLTIPGVTGVVDSGQARVLRYDERTGLDRLELSPISKASADQRAGRAGRTQPGVCLRLWPAAAHRIRPDFELPELARVDLAAAVLQVLCWIEPEVEKFPWFEIPPAGAIARARELLALLGAAEDRGITPLGREIAALPVHPRLGRLLLAGAEAGIGERAALAAALLSERDPFVRAERGPGARRGALVVSRSDVLDRVQALEAFDQSGRLDSSVGTLHRGGAEQVLRTREQLARLMGGRGQRSGVGSQDPGDREEDFLRALLAAYPDRLARRREPGSRRGVLIGGRGVRLADEVALAEEELYLAIDLDAGGAEALVRQASAVERSWLDPKQIRTETTVEFDEATGKIAARRRTSFANLLLDETQAALPSGEQVAEALAFAAATRLEEVFPADNREVAGFRTRVLCLAQWMPDLSLPTLSDDDLRELLPQLAVGRRSLAELRAAPWLHALKGRFTWQQLQSIDREAPERLAVPSGSQITLTYEVGRPPVLAVRIQEVFGLLETPRIAGGRVPVLVHLLAPNMRPAQVTSDLASFWANTYLQVRKDLRARYPKHSWPEDPYTALPQSRPGKRRD
ncbi:MAG: ATP-dependent helicase HrpB [Pirellulaceae bacterium]|nr:ATP-dependent helicase HrpB [Pirellulaceae bacterium]